MSAPLGLEQESESGAELLPDGPGRRLRATRQAQGLELDQVADQLRLSPAIIESLERDDYKALPAAVFVLGYIRKYARLVGLDPQPLLAAYETIAPRPQPPRLGTTQRPTRQVGSGHLVVRLVSVGILVLLAGLSFLWWQNQRPATEAPTADTGEESQSGSTSVPELGSEYQAPPDAGSEGLEMAAGAQSVIPEPDIQTPTPSRPPTPPATEQQPAVDVATTTTSEVTDQSTPPSSEQDAGAAGTGAGTGEQAEKAVTSAASGEIVLSFDGPCWVDVRDSERTYKLFGEMKKGDRQVLGGKPPYSVILGNAAATQITIGGKPFDLSGKSQGNVARFTLDPAQSR